MNRRAVTVQEGEKLAKEKGFGYIETSAKLGRNVEEVKLIFLNMREN